MGDKNKRSKEIDMKVRGYSEWAAFGLFFASLGEEIGWAYNMTYTGVKLLKRPSTWLLMVTAVSTQGPRVAFYEAQDVVQCFQVLYAALRARKVNWRVDKYAKGLDKGRKKD
mgnify:CR=1 FL=1